MFITGHLVMIILFSRNRDSKLAQSRAMKMLSRQALFLLLHAGKLVATGQRQRLKAPYGHGARGVAWCGAAVRTLLWKPLRHSWGCRARYRTGGCHASYRTGGCHTTEALQQQWRSVSNGRLHSFQSFLRCCLSVIRPQRIEVSMALAHISRRPSMTEAAGGRSDRGYRGCSWEQDHSCSLHLANSLLLVTEFYMT